MANYGSYARTVLTDFDELVRLVHKYSGTIVPTDKVGASTLEKIQYLTSTEVRNALNHPHADFIRSIIRILGVYIKTIRTLLEQEQPLMEQKKYIEETVSVIGTRLQLEEVEADTFQNAIAQLEKQYSALLDLQNRLDSSKAQLSEVLAKTMKMAKQFDKAWDQYRAEQLNDLATVFDEINLSLGDNARQDFLQQTTWTHLVQEMQSLKVQLPKDVDINKPDYSHYFLLKTYNAMYKSLTGGAS